VLLNQTQVQRSHKFPQPQHVSSDPAAEQPAGLTRAQVYAQLVKAEKDGSVTRLNPYRHKEEF
jgi:hypothetical protein